MQDFDTFRNRIDAIRQDHNRRMNEIRRQGHREAVILCPSVALLFAFFAWHNFSKGGDFGVGVVMSVGAVAFLALLLTSFIFNRQN